MSNVVKQILYIKSLTGEAKAINFRQRFNGLSPTAFDLLKRWRNVVVFVSRVEHFTIPLTGDSMFSRKTKPMQIVTEEDIVFNLIYFKQHSLPN